MANTTNIGSQEEPYPMLENVWNFFSEKGTKVVFVSIGTGNSCLPDLDFAETVGSPILKLDTPTDSQKWADVKEILKTRKITDTTSEFAKSATRKWVLPKNLILDESIPSFSNGTIDLSGSTLQTRSWLDIVKSHCNHLGLQDLRLDIVKIDSSPYTSSILESLWQSGFRPSLLLINWLQSPDSDMGALLNAAHLSMLGYCLIGKEGNRFLYYFTDVNYYETCSWETVSKRFENPLLVTLLKSIYPGSEGLKIHFPVEKKE